VLKFIVIIIKDEFTQNADEIVALIESEIVIINDVLCIFVINLEY